MPITSRKTVAGDTFEKLSRKVYGTELNAGLIRSANPGVKEPIPVGLELTYPQETVEHASDATNSVDEVALTILGKRFRFWDSITLKKSIDTVDTIQLTAPFEPDNAEFRECFEPFKYQPITVTVGGELVFTGTQTTVKPVNTSQGRAVSTGGYSLPGVLVDCCAPASMYGEGEGLEFENVDLRYIANMLLKPFGLKAVFIASPGLPFEQVSAKATEEVLPFLAKLAKQRSLVITSNVKGEVVFWQSNPGGKPVAKFSDTVAGPMVSIDPDFKTQQYYSDVTGVDFTGVSSEGGQHTEKNLRLVGVLRPTTFEANDAEGENLTVATQAKIGRMFGDAISYAIELDTWRDSYGNLWTPNTTVVVHAPGVMIYKPYEFLVSDIEFRRNDQGESATMTVVLLESYQGKVPKVMPWDF